LAVAASFVSTVFLSGFWLLANSIIRETLRPPAAAVALLDAGTGAVPVPRAGEGAGPAAGRAPSTAAPAGGSKAEVLDGIRARLLALRGTLAERLGFRAFEHWLRESPFTRLPPVIVLLFLIKGIFTYFAEYWLKWVGFRTIQDLRLDLFERVLGQSSRFYSKYPTGVLMSRVMG